MRQDQNRIAVCFHSLEEGWLCRCLDCGHHWYLSWSVIGTDQPDSSEAELAVRRHLRDLAAGKLEARARSHAYCPRCEKHMLSLGEVGLWLLDRMERSR